MATWLVTGGLGFIGCQVVRLLLEMGREHRVVVLDICTYASEGASRLEHYGLREGSRLRVFEGDIRDRDMVRGLVRDWSPTRWVHLAAETHVDRSIESAVPFVRTNVEGTQVLLDEALAQYPRLSDLDEFRFCHVSTDEVYGPFTGDPESDEGYEESQPLRPTNPYAATKAAAEHLAMSYHLTHDLPVVITRGSNTYGPLQSPEKFLPKMIGRAWHDLSLPIYGDGQQRRQWLSAEDHAVGIVLACLRGSVGEAYNLGGSYCPTNWECAEWIQSIVGGGKLCRVPDRPGHDLAYKISSRKAISELGWSPSTGDFVDELRELAAWYCENTVWFDRYREDLLARKGLR